MWKRFFAVVSTAVLLVVVGGTGANAAVPSGERHFAGGYVEPVYNDETGAIAYVLIPGKATVHASTKAWQPFYVPVYPVGSTVGTLICEHTPVENCATHGDEIAGAAAAIDGDVYGDGVLGHDHLMDVAGAAEFNPNWLPVLVLFTSKAAANEHLTTDAQIDAAVARGDAFEVEVPPAAFLCAEVPAGVYANAG